MNPGWSHSEHTHTYCAFLTYYLQLREPQPEFTTTFTTAHHRPGREPANPFNILTPRSKWPLNFKLLDGRDLQSLHLQRPCIRCTISTTCTRTYHRK